MLREPGSGFCYAENRVLHHILSENHVFLAQMTSQNAQDRPKLTPGGDLDIKNDEIPRPGDAHEISRADCAIYESSFTATGIFRPPGALYCRINGKMAPHMPWAKCAL